MDRIKLKENYIKTNLEYEKDLTNTLLAEIDTIDDFLEFIFEHKEEELNISRNTVNVKSDDINYCPSYYYGVGQERGKYIDDENRGYDQECEKEGYKSKIMKDYNWIEWEITYENESYRDSFEIYITPFVLNIFSYCSDNHNDNERYDREKLNIFSELFYDKWSDKLQEIVINKKKKKVKTILNDSYKLLGIDRQAKIKSILKEA
jgi:hypothetical protein